MENPRWPQDDAEEIRTSVSYLYEIIENNSLDKSDVEDLDKLIFRFFRNFVSTRKSDEVINVGGQNISVADFGTRLITIVKALEDSTNIKFTYLRQDFIEQFESESEDIKELHDKMDSFDVLYNNAKAYFIKKHSEKRMLRIEAILINSPKIAELNGLSIRDQVAPTIGDIGNFIHRIPFFIFKGQDTCKMAEFIVLKHWNESINTAYHLANEDELRKKGEYIMKTWGLAIS